MGHLFSVSSSPSPSDSTSSLTLSTNEEEIEGIYAYFDKLFRRWFGEDYLNQGLKHVNTSTNHENLFIDQRLQQIDAHIRTKLIKKFNLNDNLNEPKLQRYRQYLL